MASQPPPPPLHRRIYDLRAYVKTASTPTLPAPPPNIPRTDYAPKRPSPLRQVWNQDEVDTSDSSSSESSWDYKSISGLSGDTDSDTSLSGSSNQPPGPSPPEMYPKERVERYLSQQTHVHRHVAPPPGFSKADRGRGGLALFLEDVPDNYLLTGNGGSYPGAQGYGQPTTQDVPRSLHRMNGGQYPGAQGYVQSTTQDVPRSFPGMNGGQYPGARGYERVATQDVPRSRPTTNGRRYSGAWRSEPFATQTVSRSVSVTNGGQYPGAQEYERVTIQHVASSRPTMNGGGYPGAQRSERFATREMPRSLSVTNGGQYPGARGYEHFRPQRRQRVPASLLTNSDARHYAGTQELEELATQGYSYEVRPIPSVMDKGSYSNGDPGASSNGHQQPLPQQSQSNGLPSRLNGEASRIPRYVSPAQRSSSNHQRPVLSMGPNHYRSQPGLYAQQPSRSAE